tara:strand:+ start:339 stop:530 length:192 start_codon:yes stop_codon:yes gene_type:complete
MGALKSAMFDIGYHAEEHGIAKTAQQYMMSEDDVKLCILFVNSFTGSWEEWQEGIEQESPTIH